MKALLHSSSVIFVCEVDIFIFY